VGRPGENLRAGQQPGDRDIPADREAWRARRDRGQRRLDHRPAGRDGLEALIPSAHAASDLDRKRGDQVHSSAAQCLELVDHRGQLPLHHGPPARQHEMELMELVDPASLPRTPQFLGPAGRFAAVVFQDGHAMPVEGEQHRRRQPVESRTKHQHLCHGPPPDRMGWIGSCGQL
jgi:hypothetical protein